MTSRADFSDEEWEILVRAPLLACWAVIASAPTGSIGTVGEVQAMLGAMVDIRRAHAADSIVGALATSLRHRLDQSELRVRELPEPVLRQRALEAAREALEVLARHQALEELPPYREWLTQLATTVASASKEGGGLGPGGRVQPEESTLIDELREALEQGSTDG